MKRWWIATLMAVLAVPAWAQDGEAAKEPTDAQRYQGCINAIPTHAAEAEEFALQWRGRGGGLPAHHCQGLAQLQQGRFAESAATLAAAARAAETEKSPFAADFWGQAGNAAVLAGDNRMALGYFTTAITQAGTDAPERAAAFLVDRARVQTEIGEMAAARADLDHALALDPEDADAWMLSAALARRQDDIGRAVREIARASELAGDDPDVMLEQGNIAAANGDVATARQVWEQVRRVAPQTPAAELAQKALTQSAAVNPEGSAR